MCPLRVIVILLSLIVALIALFISMREDKEEDLTQPAKSWREIITEFATGKYLYKQLKPWFKSKQNESDETDATEEENNEEPGLITAPSAPSEGEED
jgi:hypothetical protein